MTETVLTGYCRVHNAARTVLVDRDDRDADCSYPDCAYRGECPIAAEIDEFLSAETKK